MKVFDLTDAAEAAGRVEQGGGGVYPGRVVLTPEDHTPLLAEVLAKGHTISVDSEGRPSITEPSRSEVPMQTEEIIRRAEGLGCQDREALFSLRWGAVSHADPAKVSSFQPNHSGALTNAAELVKILAQEVTDKMMKVMSHPPCIPLCVRPMSLVAKWAVKGGELYVRGWRLVLDGSFPNKGRRGALVRDIDGVERHLAPNMEYRKDQPWFDYWSLSRISQAVAMLMAAAGFIGCELYGSCFDFKGWFRQLPMNNMDIWQNVQTWGGKYYKDKRVAMGYSFSSSIAQRVAFIILDICEAELDAQLEGYLCLHEVEGWVRKLRDWIGRRKSAYPDRPSQWRPWHLSSFQDDTPAVVLRPLAKWLDSVIKRVLEELGVPLSGKEKPPSEKFEAIGGAYDCTQPEASLGPAEAAALSFVEDAGKVSHARESGQGVGNADYESAKGRAEWIGSFLQNGPERCHPIHKAWADRDREAGCTHPTAKVEESMEATRKDLEDRNLAPLIRDPTYLHGRMAAAADASTADGWGAHVGVWCANGMWSQATKDAIERSKEKEKTGDRVSTSPLELMTQALLLVLVMEVMGEELRRRWKGKGPMQVVLRCDNQSSCDVVLSRRPQSDAMREALRILEEVEKAYGVHVRLEHIPTDMNVIADRLSHARLEEVEQIFAKAGCAPKFLPEEQEVMGSTLMAFATSAEKRVTQALLRAEMSEFICDDSEDSE